MKIEFIKERDVRGDVFYYTQIDGNFVSGSSSKDEAVGKKIYEAVLNAKGKSTIEVLFSEEI